MKFYIRGYKGYDIIQEQTGVLSSQYTYTARSKTTDKYLDYKASSESELLQFIDNKLKN